MTSALTHEPMSDAALERLQELLESGGAGKAMNMERLDGFMSALVAGPDLVMPSEYLPLVWGGESAGESPFATEQELQEFFSLLTRHWNAIVSTLESGDAYVPIFLEDEKGLTHGFEWAKGFMQGVNLRRGSWADLIADEEASGAILPIALMAGEVEPGWPHEPLTDEKREEMLVYLAAGLMRIYQHFAPHRKSLARLEREEHTYRRPAPKIGRNDPCPCGSGRKYKHCCARTDTKTLH